MSRAHRATPGHRWRLLAHRADGTEVTCSDSHGDGCFDELIVDRWLHVEQMDTREWFVQIGDARSSVTIPACGDPRVLVEQDEYCRCAKRPCRHQRAVPERSG